MYTDRIRAFGIFQSNTNFRPSAKHLYYLLKANHLTCRVSKYDQVDN